MTRTKINLINEEVDKLLRAKYLISNLIEEKGWNWDEKLGDNDEQLNRLSLIMTHDILTARLEQIVEETS